MGITMINEQFCSVSGLLLSGGRGYESKMIASHTNLASEVLENLSHVHIFIEVSPS